MRGQEKLPVLWQCYKTERRQNREKFRHQNFQKKKGFLLQKLEKSTCDMYAPLSSMRMPLVFHADVPRERNREGICTWK